VPEPSRTLAFLEEADSRGYNEATWVMNPDSRTWEDVLAVFHDGQSTIAFADGHAESHRWLEDTTVAAAAAAQRDLDAPIYPRPPKSPRDRDFEWIEPRYKYRDWPKYLP
jgi:prepilin-type processing-associated H-X9-DG protein